MSDPVKEIKNEADLLAYLSLVMQSKEKYILLYALNDVIKAVTEDYFKFQGK